MRYTALNTSRRSSRLVALPRATACLTPAAAGSAGSVPTWCRLSHACEMDVLVGGRAATDVHMRGVARLQGGMTPRARAARFLPGISRGSSALFLAGGEEEAFRTFPPLQEAASGGSTMNAPDRYEKFVVPEGVQKCEAHCCCVCSIRSLRIGLKACYTRHLVHG